MELLFERPTDSTYPSWAEKMKCFLIRAGLWKAAQKAPDMDGDDEPPVNNNSIIKDRGDKLRQRLMLFARCYTCGATNHPSPVQELHSRKGAYIAHLEASVTTGCAEGTESEAPFWVQHTPSNQIYVAFGHRVYRTYSSKGKFTAEEE
uniref:Uncharacterized protein n=1 Tax=Sphaerodactylus townsendi TaxID=933632 RepID=A0ACB8GEA0_9SAUR